MEDTPIFENTESITGTVEKIKFDRPPFTGGLFFHRSRKTKRIFLPTYRENTCIIGKGVVM